MMLSGKAWREEECAGTRHQRTAFLAQKGEYYQPFSVIALNSSRGLSVNKTPTNPPTNNKNEPTNSRDDTSHEQTDS